MNPHLFSHCRGLIVHTPHKKYDVGERRRCFEYIELRKFQNKAIFLGNL